jgi:hypothetical protein
LIVAACLRGDVSCEKIVEAVGDFGRVSTRRVPSDRDWAFADAPIRYGAQNDCATGAAAPL